MSSAAKTALTRASPTTPAGIGTARSASGWRRKPGLRRARPSCCQSPISTWCLPLPAAIGAVAYQNKAKVYGLLFKAAAETLTTIPADQKHLGADIGLTAVLHTWGQNLDHHPHVHCIVPGGGVSPDGVGWVPCRPDFFLPVRVLLRLFRRLFVEGLQVLHDAGDLQFFTDLAHLKDADVLRSYLAPLRNIEWVVYAKRPFAGPAQVLAYLARYTSGFASICGTTMHYEDRICFSVTLPPPPSALFWFSSRNSSLWWRSSRPQLHVIVTGCFRPSRFCWLARTRMLAGLRPD